MAKFEAKGLEIWKSAEWHEQPNGTARMSIGFPVAKVWEHITNGEQVAQAIAEILSASKLGEKTKSDDVQPVESDPSKPSPRIGW